jgi:hypothetical protein
LGDVAANGDKPPATNPVVYDIDGFDNTGTDNGDESSSLSSSGSPVVKELHKLGDHVSCYIDVGTAENWRPDYSEFPAAVLGRDNGWPGERWLDIAPGPYLSAVQRIMTARFRMCADNGFDAVEPDNIDGAENETGFAITIPEQIAYDKWVATTVHALGMSVAQKNFEDQSTSLEPYFDFSIEEQCFQYDDCSDLAPYTKAGKAVFEAEYQGQGSAPAAFCPGANALGFNSVEFDLDLDAKVRVPCR